MENVNEDVDILAFYGIKLRDDWKIITSGKTIRITTKQVLELVEKLGIKEKHASIGLKLGETSSKEQRLSSSFLRTYGKESILRVKISDEDLQKLLKDKKIDIDFRDGYCTVTYDGMVLGRGWIKNKKLKIEGF